MWCHVCPVAWLKITKLCSSLSNFPAFLATLKVWLFFENRETKPYIKAVKQDVFSRFFKGTVTKWQLFKKVRLFWLKSEDKPNNRYISKTFSPNTVFLLKKCSFLDCFLGQRWLHWCVDDQNYDQNKSNWYGCLLHLKVDNTKAMFVPKVLAFFPLVYWFLSLTLTDKQGTIKDLLS